MSELPAGYKVMLLGDTGAGKTYSIRTLVEAGIETFVLFTERSMQLLDDLPEDKLHWHYVGPGTIPWDTLEKAATKINRFNFQQLASMDANDKREHDQFLDLIRVCHDFTCERCGQSFGDVSEWSPERALVVDGLSGISSMAMQLFTGSRPVLDKPHYMIAQRMVQTFLTKCVFDLEAWFVLIGHLERGQDEVSGRLKLMPNTVGRALAPNLPPMFDEVIEAIREGDEWYWSTTSDNVTTKTRLLPREGKLRPDFGLLVEQHQKRSKR